MNPEDTAALTGGPVRAQSGWATYPQDIPAGLNRADRRRRKFKPRAEQITQIIIRNRQSTGGKAAGGTVPRRSR